LALHLAVALAQPLPPKLASFDGGCCKLRLPSAEAVKEARMAT